MELWDALGRAGVPAAERMRAAARALPRRTARRVLQWAERGLRSTESVGEGAPPEGARAGVGPDPDRTRNDDLVRTWLRAWLQDPERPSVPFEAALAEAAREQVEPNLAALVADEAAPEGTQPAGGGPEAGERAGAVTFDLGGSDAGPARADAAPRHGKPRGTKPRKGRARSAPAPSLVKPAAWRLGGNRPPPADPRQLCNEKDLDRVATDAMLAKLADGTRATYRGGVAVVAALEAAAGRLALPPGGHAGREAGRQG